jgi:hypothetical protein
LPLSAVSGVLAGHAIPHETPQQQPPGPLVAPGVYTVELRSGNKTERQQITVQVDPRVHASQADLDDQLKLARESWAALRPPTGSTSQRRLSTPLSKKANSQPQATEQLKS